MPTPGAFGWAEHDADPEAYWAAREGYEMAEHEAARQRREAEWEWRAQRRAVELLASLRRRGLLREDGLSYTRICELERETGIWTGPWSEYYELLREAQRKDEERCPARTAPRTSPWPRT